MEQSDDTRANSRQVGGDHYKSTYQHWDWISAIKLPYLSATATKYITRYKKKQQPVQDVEKSQHYLEKFVEEELIRREEHIALTAHFISHNGITGEEKTILESLVLYQLGDVSYLKRAQAAMSRLVEAVRRS